ncbi:MAG: hypothetical protein ABSG33_02715 [Candidatus Bathyarchaeia archaeon]|jgi:uncharacterized protein YlbG (UPF0298 family)
MTKTVCVRISEEEKRQLQKYGKLSDVLREAVELYLNAKKSDGLLQKLADLQAKNPIKTTIEEEVSLIREDRNR